MLIEWNGQTYKLKDISKNFGISQQTLSRRLKRGLTVSQALAIPYQQSIREQSKKRGAKYVGKKCTIHNNRVRYESNGLCIDCVAARSLITKRKRLAATNGLPDA